MNLVTDIIISVELTHNGKHLVSAEVIIPLPENESIRASLLIDACQRSVAHCISELQKHLDIS